MGLFGGGATKKAKVERDAAEKAVNQKAAATIDEATIDLDEANTVVDVLCDTIGGSLPQLESAVRRLSAASGMADPANAGAQLAAYDREGKYATTRCWRWLNSVARNANHAGRAELAAKVYMWSSWWIGAGFEGWANGANHIAIGIDRCPESEILGIIDSAQTAVKTLPDDLVLSETIVEPVTVGLVSSALNTMIEIRDSSGIETYRHHMRQAMS